MFESLLLTLADSHIVPRPLHKLIHHRRMLLIEVLPRRSFILRDLIGVLFDGYRVAKTSAEVVCRYMLVKAAPFPVYEARWTKRETFQVTKEAFVFDHLDYFLGVGSDYRDTECLQYRQIGRKQPEIGDIEPLYILALL